MANLYDKLGVDPEASADDIKKMYRKKAMALHPDRGGDPDEFKKVNAAYRVLSNPARRQEYDRTGDEDAGHQDDRTSAILQHVSWAMKQVICFYDQIGSGLTSHDFVKSMVQTIDAAIKKNEEQAAKLEAVAENMKVLLGRFESDSDENLLEDMAKSEISGLIRVAKNFRLQCDQQREAIEFLKHYKFRNDDPAKAMMNMLLGIKVTW